MEIPQKLRDKDIRFVLVNRGQKLPFQKEWQKKNITWDSFELQEHLKQGGNYGVIGGGNKKLVVIDFDNLDVQQEVYPKLPKTFTILTGSGKYHLYFFSDDCKSFKIFDSEMNTISDIQGEGKQVIGAGSIHPNGNKYSVVEDRDIAFINYGELKAILMPYDKSKRNENNTPKFNEIICDNEDKLKRDFIEKIKSYVSVQDVLNSFGIDTSKNPTQCPFHDSKGGKCLGFNKETWHCFHCEEKGNIFSLVQKKNNCNFAQALEFLAQMGNLEQELIENRKKYLLSKNMERISTSIDIDKHKILSDYLLIPKEDRAKKSEFLVSYILSKLKIYTVKDDKNSEMWVYSNGIYIPNGICEIQILLRELLNSEYDGLMVKKVVEKIMAQTYIDKYDFFAINYIDEIPLENGILNVFTRELKPYTPDKIFFNKFPVLYDEKVTCPKIDLFLKDILSKADDIKVFYEIAGFGLLKDYRFEKAVMFVGYGRNGKSKSLELLKRMVGSENCSALPIYLLKADEYSVSGLFGKVFNIAGDLSSGDLKETGTFKALTGRDPITTKRKYLNDLTFSNYAKLIFACNNLPRVYDTSVGFWDRWILLDFPYTFVTQEEYNKAEDKTNLKIRDIDIISKITTPEEMSGLLNRALEGLNRLITNSGNFSYSIGTAEIKNTWIRRSDSFTAFCMDMLEEDSENFIIKSELRKNYSVYCRKHKIMSRNDKAIIGVLQELYGVSEDRSTVYTTPNDSYGTQEYIWRGIKWKKQK